MKSWLGVMVLLTLSACTAPAARTGLSTQVPLGTYSGGDGSTVAKAVIIDAVSDFAATRTEHAWLAEHAPGATLTRQSLLHSDQHVYDLLEIVLPDKSTRSYFFDITQTYGKY